MWGTQDQGTKLPSVLCSQKVKKKKKGGGEEKMKAKIILSNILLSEFSLNKNNIGTAHFSKVHLTPFCFHKRLTLAPVFAS